MLQSEKIIKIEPQTLEERNAQTYIEYIQELADKRNPSDIFYNEGKTYASILMATLLLNTHKSLQMYCTGLRPGILCGKKEGDGQGYEGAYWKAFKDFFTPSNIENFGGKIQILIQKEKWKDNMPFQLVFDCQQYYSKKIEIKRIRGNVISRLYAKFHKGVDIWNYNFAIFDGKAYRIEYDPDRYMARGSFNDEKMSNMLSRIFEEKFLLAEEVKNPLMN